MESVISGVLDDALKAVVHDVVRDVLKAEREEQRPADVSPWLDVAGVASYAVMTPAAVRAATKRGQLKSYRSTTGRVRYRVEDVESFLRGDES